MGHLHHINVGSENLRRGHTQKAVGANEQESCQKRLFALCQSKLEEVYEVEEVEGILCQFPKVNESVGCRQCEIISILELCGGENRSQRQSREIVCDVSVETGFLALDGDVGLGEGEALQLENVDQALQLGDGGLIDVSKFNCI